MTENPEQAFGGTRPMLALIELLYAAAQEPALWPEVLGQISRLIGGESIAVYGGAPNISSPALVAMQNCDAAQWRPYAEYYSTINPLYPACEAMFVPEETWYSDLAISDDELEKTEFYNDFYLPNKMHYSLGLFMPIGDGLPALLSCQRPKTKGPFTAAADVISTVLRPHLQRAFLLHHQAQAMQTTALGFDAALTAFDHAVIGIDKTGRVAMLNERASLILATAQSVSMTNQRLHCSNFDENRKLQHLLSEVLKTSDHNGLSAGGTLSMRNSAGETTLRITVAPYTNRVRGSSKSLSALVFLSNPSESPRTRAVVLRASYGLTSTEARLADSLLKGLDLRETAQMLSMSVETARFHSKRILNKTGTRRQSELIKLLLSIPVLNETP